MSNGLLDPAIVAFVFTPLIITVAVLLALWWKRMQNNQVRLDAPGWLLASAVRAMPEARVDWGAAMLAELAQIQNTLARWRFALGCARVALFPPYAVALLRLAGRNPMFGMLSVALPPLGLPFIYFAAVIIEAIGGSPFTQSSRWSNPDAVIVIVNIVVKLLFVCLLAGLPLGLIGWLRHERMRVMSLMGMCLSLGMISYFLIGMYFLAGGD